MKLSNFIYELPEKLVAKYPNKNRDESRLMVIDRSDYSIQHRLFKDMIDYFNEDDVIVLNNTKVFPARLYGNKEISVLYAASIWVFISVGRKALSPPPLTDYYYDVNLWGGSISNYPLCRVK